LLEISKKLLRIVGQTNARYGLFEQGDRILLGLSGGKDSIALAHILSHFQRVSPLSWEFAAVTIGYGIGEDFGYLRAHCAEHAIPHEVVDSQIFATIEQNVRANSSLCSFCARLRRGHLYTYAKERGFNKLAIAHHFDDAVESFFMNFSNNGALRTLAPRYTASNGITVIRPLILARERQIAGFVRTHGIQVVSEDEWCPAKRTSGKMPHARAETKALLSQLERANPNLFISLRSAFENVHIDTFFGQNLHSNLGKNGEICEI